MSVDSIQFATRLALSKKFVEFKIDSLYDVFYHIKKKNTIIIMLLNFFDTEVDCFTQILVSSFLTATIH